MYIYIYPNHHQQKCPHAAQGTTPGVGQFPTLPGWRPSPGAGRIIFEFNWKRTVENGHRN